MPDCDHLVAVDCRDDGGFVSGSEVKQMAAFALDDYQKWARNPAAWQVIVAERAAWTARQHFEKEYTIFTFCPDCGEKIDWELLHA